MLISNIDTPIERGQTKGNPNALLHYGVGLSAKQRRLLEKLPHYDSKARVHKKDINMSDLSALTAYTGDEFAMFTKGNKRIIIRGNMSSVNIDVSEAERLADDGYRWSGHTHPGIGNAVLIASTGDKSVLRVFKQPQSVIYDSTGSFQQFYKE